MITELSYHIRVKGGDNTGSLNLEGDFTIAKFVFEKTKQSSCSLQ